MLRADDASIVFKEIPSKVPKLIVMASSQSAVEQVQSKRSDPTIRGFENTAKSTVKNNETIWGTRQDSRYKFVKFEVCTWHSFGVRATDQQPHPFAAQQLLEQLATDPGIVAIMRERQLVVNLLGEMDPIDDRLMQKKQEHGACLLGYNTNHGLAIHIRLRTMDLQGFMPYPQLVATLIHELSHNWVGEHDLLFWGNFAQMRVEYLHTHARLAAEGYISQGKSTAVIAGVSKECQNGLAGIADAVMKELAGEMPQYGLSPVPLRQAIVDRCRQLTEQFESMEQGRKLGGSELRQDARRAALEAAEKRARDSSQNQDKR
ncbi:hypothetical protein FisN_15Lh239 [Fistulifera solaris]|uniref:WLM domain-containing protein n=1 Tax=Fistulifera solaris TaxID=1519565 RepID=A0A1Z5JBD7_FISSO|nr:hypothetical protein FisN_15Lh239 [Fistulifera solaris]|eukprot:GAX11310.1 hypothetical protein FisN_15Lh239 [Fistulifera solaris]